MTKANLRRIYREKRLGLSSSQRLKLDDLLLIQLQRLALPDYLQMLMTFYPLELQAEVDTFLYTRYLQHAVPGLQVAYPVVNTETQGMTAVTADDDTEFVENIYGIPEPIYDNASQVSPQDIDMIFVPLLAFDNAGLRVGYGKGYYDRFLAGCRSGICKVGFSYFEAVDKIDDTNQYDVPLDYCITPERIYEF